MNLHPLPRNHDSGSAHPLYIPEQAFLWLPGLPGEELPFCSYNAAPRKPSREALHETDRRDAKDTRDANGAPLSPPYPVSRETFIAWNTRENPHFPYHPVPLAHTLSEAEMITLGKRVAAILGLDPKNPLSPDPLQLLKDENKPEITTALSNLGLLARRDFPPLHVVEE